jgi:hypothetical protein
MTKLIYRLLGWAMNRNGELIKNTFEKIDLEINMSREFYKGVEVLLPGYSSSYCLSDYKRA